MGFIILKQALKRDSIANQILVHVIVVDFVSLHKYKVFIYCYASSFFKI